MQPIGKILNSPDNAALQRLRRLASSRTATDQPVDPITGLPLDHTVCPGCRNATFVLENRTVYVADECDICKGLGIVCPTCRGARVVSTNARLMSASPVEACRDCMRPRIDPETGRQKVHALSGRPMWELDEQREIDCIQRYRDGRDAEVPQPMLANGRAR